MDIPLAVRPLLLAAACGAGILWSLYRFLIGTRNAHLVADTPLVRLRSAAQGYVKAYGRARVATAEPPRSPLTAKPCVWWSYEIERRERNRSGAAWRQVESEASIAPFVLDDGDGECLVGPICATIVPTAKNTWFGDTPWPEGPPGLYWTWFSSGAYRYTERRIDVDAMLTVVGELRSRSDVGDVATEAGILLREWKQDQAELLRRFDANRDGRISSAEWDAARSVATAEASTLVVRNTISRSAIIQLPTNGEAFIIAPMDSDRLARRERLQALAYLAAGVAFVALWVWARDWPWFH
jgi:hypothetical protein